MILHRDIKPENVFLRPSSSSSSSSTNHRIYPDIVLADFGLATHRPPSSHPTHGVGTLRYQGPELPLHSTASDIWCLGATIHALAHGYPPMCPRADNMSEKEWEWDPRSRQVED
ncbi:MAG: hypothetical protein Q9201_006998, partial [Fulgogasparrea decipioides]